MIRDRMGVKPLFYYPTPDGVLFGSEPKVILAHPRVPPRVGRDGLREILVLAKNPEATIYAGMHEVRPGQIVRVSRDGLVKRRYWMLTAREHKDDLPRTIETVAKLLDDIVRRQIVSDVPLCSLLSGGLDCSAVTAIANSAMTAQSGGRIRSFSVDFADHAPAQYFTATLLPSMCGSRNSMRRPVPPWGRRVRNENDLEVLKARASLKFPRIRDRSR